MYVPADSLNDTKQLDVIVVIHGGAFMVGSGHYALNTFLDKDVVLVSFNYRLGILGKHLLTTFFFELLPSLLTY